MIHCDNQRLHTESKEFSRRKSKEAKRGLKQRVDADETSDCYDETSSNDDETNPGDKATSASDEETTTDTDQLTDFDTSTTSDTDESTTDNDQKNIGNTTETLRQLDRRTIEDSDDEYDYYNPKDKRLWKEKE